ncbi:MAG TPA: lysophospholipid acyltransferase family protein [Steroidobacteraceae bacterium]|jgi:KDO2-lipid IV(A) lauroyltransferase|nr:lysophospholipid acyltransferase family protein [Steroidobacteraceae bacterium]
MSPPTPGRAVWWLRICSALPWGVIYALTGLLGFLARYVVRFKVGIVRDNLARCFPERSGREINALVNAYYRQLGQVVAEILKTNGLSAEQMKTHFTTEGFELIDAEIAAGRSVITLGAHMGNWEWTLHAITLRIPAQIDAAYKPLHNEGSDRQLRLQRVRYGANLIAAKRLLREVLARRKRVGVHCVAIHADQMPTSSQSRHWLTFLGRDTAFYPGPGEIARMTGYAAFFIASRRTSRGHYRVLAIPLSAAQEKVDPAVFTARYAAAVETEIRLRPADWTWLHRRWKGVRPPAVPPTSP